MRSLKIRPQLPFGRLAVRLPALLLMSALALLTVLGQGLPEPRREQLLNGLRALLVHRPADPNVLVKLRLHSGAAFDLAEKEGMMSLLAAAMFDAEDFRFVEEDLGGRLEVQVDYDAMSVTVAAPARDFGRVIELLRSSLTNFQLTPEAVARLRAERVELARAQSLTTAVLADRAVAARLFSPHPYARVTEGKPTSLARIEYADLHLARERFINPNNTTLVIIGGVEPRAVMRLLRQTLGGWRKSDRLVPATFRRPEAPDARTLVINHPGSDKYEIRLAVAGLARTDRDRAAAEVLASLAAERWRAASPELRGAEVFVKHESFRDGGLFRLGASTRSAAEAAAALATAHEVLRQLAAQPITSAQLETARQAVATIWAQAAQSDDGTANLWLDAHTYDATMISGPEARRTLNALTPAEVQRVAARLFQHTPAAAVAVGNADDLRTELTRTGVEVFDEAAGKTAPPPASAPAPSVKDAPKQPAIQLKRPW